jgi:hypothetical protein
MTRAVLGQQHVGRLETEVHDALGSVEWAENGGLGLTRTGGQVDPPVAAGARLTLQFGDDSSGEAASAVAGVRPDPLQLGRGRVVPAEGAARDRLAV